MSDVDFKQKIALLQNVNLTTLQSSKEFFEAVICAYVKNELPERSLRALTYALRGYLDYLKHEDELAALALLDQIQDDMLVLKGRR